MSGLTAARDLLQRGVGSAYPAAALVCGRGRPELSVAVGAAGRETWFDLASLTKALCTSVLAMRLYRAGKLDLDEPVPLSGGSAPVRLWHLLAHCSGLPAGPPPLWAQHSGLLAAPSVHSRRSVVQMALATPAGPAARQSVYSDLGFIILGEILEARAGASLAEQFRALVEPLGAALAFRPLQQPAHPVAAERCAPTRRESAARELLRGTVHDDNARAMLGVAGHAGLFGTAAGVYCLAMALLDTLAEAGTPGQRALGLDAATVRRFFAERAESGLTTTWGLGWDHPEPLRPFAATSSAGSLWPRSGVGHLGFTGCSLWLDPERRGAVVLLSNRVCAATPAQAEANKAALRLLRPALHDAIQRAWQGRDAE